MRQPNRWAGYFLVFILLAALGFALAEDKGSSSTGALEGHLTVTAPARPNDGLLKRELVSRREGVSQFIGQEGFPSKPGPWIVPTKAGTARMPKELDVAFPPSGNWLMFDGLPLNSQPPDLLIQLIEYIFVRDGVIGQGSGGIRPAPVLEEFLARIGEIKAQDGLVGDKD